MKHWKLVFVGALSVVTLIIFQNCASDFDAEAYTSQLEAASSNPSTTPTSTPTNVQPPTITTGLLAASVNVGDSATFSITAEGASLQYRWSKNGALIPDANSNSYTVAGAQSIHAGTYVVEVFNSAGSQTSQATLTVTTAPPPLINIPPTITAQPQDEYVFEGEYASITVAASGPDLTYQWYKLQGSTPAPVGTNSRSLEFSNAIKQHSGFYYVIVKNTYGQVQSLTVNLIVEVGDVLDTR